MFSFFSAVLAFPPPLGRKLNGLATGFAVIFVLNALRVISLYVSELHWPAVFDDAHVYVWQTVIILIVMALWMRWARDLESI